MRFLRRNVLLVYGVYVVTLVSGLVVTPILVRELGAAGYGLWAFISSIVVFLALLDFGVGPTIIRFAAEQRGRGAVEETSALAANGLAVYAPIATATAAVGALLAWLLPWLIDVPDRLVGPGRIALLLVLAAYVARFPLGLYTNLLAGQQRYDVVNLGSLVAAILYAVLVAAILLLWGGGIVTVAAVTLLATVVRLSLPLAWLRRELPTLRVRPSLVSRRAIGRLLRFSSHNFLIHVASKVVLSTDVIVVGALLGSVAAAWYGLPSKLFGLVFGIGVAASTLLFPVLSELEGAEEHERQRRYALTGIRVGMAVVLAAAVPLILLPERFLEAWLGGEYDEEGFARSVPVLVLLMLSLLFVHPSNTLGQFLVARARHARLAVARIATVAANLVLSLVLVATVGLWGVAVATLVTEGLAAAVVVPLLVRDASGISVASLAGAWLRPVALAAVAALPTLVLVGRLLPVDSLVELGALVTLWLALFGALVWRVGLEPGERRAIRNALGRGEPGVVAAPREEAAL